jgi:putative GTP pyrophosphokinase
MPWASPRRGSCNDSKESNMIRVFPMAFSPVPTESKSQINKAGQTLVKESPHSEIRWAIDLVDRWRACHAYPINTFQANLRKKLKEFPNDSIAAQRLKRMPTIIDKLKRYPAMKLTTMQDIGGLRAILASIGDVYQLTDQFRHSRFAHELIDTKDYIENPRSEDGYRGIHLIYRYKNKQAPSYDGLRVELQIRTKLQHIWATAVETMGTFLGQALKSRQGDKEWIDFFAIVSSAFAHKENCAPIPRFNTLSVDETFQEVARAEASLQALDKMKDLSIAADSIVKSKGFGYSYHLIILNSFAHTVEVKSYDRDSFNQAMIEYTEVEARAARGEKIESVLVSAGPFDKLRWAYPNFFLDIKDFTATVHQIVNFA